MGDTKLKKRGLNPYRLPTDARGAEAWFYTNDTSVDIVVRQANGTTAQYRFKLKDMRRIVEHLK